MRKITGSLPFRLLLGIVLDVIVGQLAGNSLMYVAVTIKCILNQIIVFCVPLTIIGFIVPSITRLGNNASEMLGITIVIACVSSIGVALFSMTADFLMILHPSIAIEVEGLKDLSEIVSQLDTPQIMSVMSTLVFSLLPGLVTTWTRTAMTTQVLEKFRQIALPVVTKVVIPILPALIAFIFCALSYEGTIIKQLPVFTQAVIIIIIGHCTQLAPLYTVGGAYSGKDPLDVIKNYGPAYIIVMGAMSSAATLAVVLRCTRESQPPLGDDMMDFGIPLFANVHLCGSVLTEISFVMTISKVLYGTIPSLGTVILLYALLDIFAIGAPGVPGGMVMVSLGLITDVLGFDEARTVLMLVIFAPQDSFGAVCNVAGDRALTMVLTGFAKKHRIERQKIESGL